MPGRKGSDPCVVCNPEGAEPGEYCSKHRDELHRLDHQYEALFRLARTSRGKDHETYNVFLQGDCDPSGRVLVTETDPENLSLTVLLSTDLDLDARITDYSRLGISRTYGDQLRDRLQKEIIHSWYGNARACIDIFQASSQQAVHWDIGPRETMPDEDEGIEPDGSQGGSHSVH